MKWPDGTSPILFDWDSMYDSAKPRPTSMASQGCPKDVHMTDVSRIILCILYDFILYYLIYIYISCYSVHVLHAYMYIYIYIHMYILHNMYIYTYFIDISSMYISIQGSPIEFVRCPMSQCSCNFDPSPHDIPHAQPPSRRTRCMTDGFLMISAWMQL